MYHFHCHSLPKRAMPLPYFALASHAILADFAPASHAMPAAGTGLLSAPPPLSSAATHNTSPANSWRKQTNCEAANQQLFIGATFPVLPPKMEMWKCKFQFDQVWLLSAGRSRRRRRTGDPHQVPLLLWGGELCYSPRIQTWELSWGQLCSQSSCEVVAKSYIKRVLQNQLWRWQMFTFQTCVTTCDNVSKVQFSELQCFISVTRREVQCWDIHPENIQSWMWQCGKS